MAGGYFNDDQNDKMKTLLYPYLMDKFQRRAAQTSGAAYAGREAGYRQDEDNADARGLVSVLGDSASMAGTLQGKRSDVGQLPKYMSELTANDQERNQNLFKERSAEEQALGTDLNVAKFVGDEDYKNKDLNQRAADKDEDRKARLQQYLAEIQRKKEADALHDKEFGMTYGQRERQYGESNRLREKQIDKPGGAGSPSYQVDPNMVGPNGESVLRNSKDPNDTRLAPMPGGAQPKKQPGSEKITDTERNSAMFYGNAGNALSVLEQMEGKGYKPGGMTALKSKLTPDGLEGYTLSPDEQRYKQAAEDFTAAKLRLESGAAIPQSEIAQQARIYMIQPGDSAQVIAQKKLARKQALEGLRFKAGPGADKIGRVEQPAEDNDPTKMPDDKLKAEYDRLKAKGHIK